MKYTCLVIDDEKAARAGLVALLEEFSDVNVLATCANGIEAIDQIRALQPDIIFLDVQMPGINGFEVLLSLHKPWPQVVFTTAHDQFALRAFEVNAVDYLLKPFSDERFAEALQRAKQNIGRKEIGLNSLVNRTRVSLQSSASVVNTGSGDERLVIKADGSVHLLEMSDVIYVEAFDYYVKIHVQTRFFLLRETMKSLERRLPESVFVRTHKSYIVNLSFVKTLHKLDNHEYETELLNGTRLKVSRSYRPQVMQLLGLA